MNYMGSVLIVIKDSNERLFGAWLGETIKPSKGAYYGSGESYARPHLHWILTPDIELRRFLWKFAGDSDNVVGNLKIFKWTGRNDYVALCELGYLSFGGGSVNLVFVLAVLKLTAIFVQRREVWTVP
jgi:hypothetical protein